MKSNELSADAKAARSKYFKNRREANPLSEEARKAKSLYQKEWRKAHPEKVKKYQARWIKEHPERWKELQNAYWERKAKLLASDQDVTDKNVLSVTSVSQCLMCGKELSDKRKGAKYCGVKCRVTFNRKNKHHEINKTL